MALSKNQTHKKWSVIVNRKALDQTKCPDSFEKKIKFLKRINQPNKLKGFIIQPNTNEQL